ncbi:MAG: Uma2 family endonuclease, partial [Snowella sp.]|nr:Uma2 family endonuclease [Snowella sp.]
ELLSDSTAKVDRTTKRELYAERFHTPEYFYFSPDTLEFAGFKLDYNQYIPLTPNDQGWFWSESLGFFLGIHSGQLRYFSLEGRMIPTPEEAAKDEILKANRAVARAERETLRAEQETLRAERLATKLRELGIDPDES